MIRLYGALLRLLPSGFRRRYSDEMVAFVRDGLGELRGAARLRFAARVSVDLAATISMEWARVVTAPVAGAPLRQASRSVRRRPQSSLVAVATLGLGLGSFLAMFALVDGVVLRPLPYDEPDRLVSMWTTFDNTGEQPFGVSLAEQYDYREDTRALEAIGGVGSGDVTLTGVGDARRISAAYTWLDFYEVAGLGTVLGRLPIAAETEAGAEPIVLLGHDFWQAALAGSPDVVGRVLEIEGVSVTVLGVLEPDAALPSGDRPDVWVPTQVTRSDITNRSGHSMDVLARLAPGLSLSDARADRDRILAAWAEQFAGEHSPGLDGHRIRIESAHTAYFGELIPVGRLLLAAGAVLLLLACANVATLLIALGQRRAEEFAVRRSLGASPASIVAHLVAEGGVIALGGAVVGGVLGAVGVRAMLSMAPAGIPRIDSVPFDTRTVAALVAAGTLAVVLFAVLPALRGARLSTRGEVGADRGLSRALGASIGFQVALAVVLVSGSSVLGRSVIGLLNHDHGAVVEGRLVADVSVPAARYPEVADAARFWDEMLTRLEAHPSVEQAAWIRSLPMRDGLRGEGMIPTGADDGVPISNQTVSSGYSALAGVDLLEGRRLQPQDVAGSMPVAVVNRAAAEAYWPDTSPVGTTVSPEWLGSDIGPVTIVGVIENVAHEGPRVGPAPEFYMSYSQLPEWEGGWVRSGTVIVTGPGDLQGAVRSVVAELDPSVPVDGIASWSSIVRASVATERFVATLVGVFAVVALLLAGLGTWGVATFVTERRRREIGVRVALGADSASVVRAVVLRGARVASIGALAGVAVALALGPALRPVRFGVGDADPVSLLGPAVLLVGVAALACLVPAIRAGRTDPGESLRAEN